jgi:7,8-dihydropterin-6-yl-methyl-4-(beta-D-ribofuranosyl)aminobenzene 5'-phosphate synthase
VSIELTILAADECEDQQLRDDPGLCLLVQGPGRSVLFDTGADPGALLHNAQQLKIDLAGVSTVVLSHGHRDHTAGLGELAQIHRGLHIYAHPLAFSRRWHQPPGRPLKDVSCPHRLERLVEMGAVFHAVKAPELIEPWLLLSGPIGGPRDGVDHFVIRRNDDIIPDWFQDELCLLVKTRRGWLIITGCCHRGLKNTLRCAKFLAREEPLHALVGGLHMQLCDTQQMREAIQILGQFGNPGLYPCHCTGKQAGEYLSKRLPGQVHPIRAGTRLRF